MTAGDSSHQENTTLTIDDAKAIAKVLESADGYCTYCAADLAESMQKLYPQFNWRDLVFPDEYKWYETQRD